MGVLIIVLSFFAVRIIGSSYEKQLELKNSTLESEVVNLSKLNADLVTYKEVVVKKSDEEKVDTSSESSKKRILTYIRNELVPVNIEEISHIYTRYHPEKQKALYKLIGFSNIGNMTNLLIKPELKDRILLCLIIPALLLVNALLLELLKLVFLVVLRA